MRERRALRGRGGVLRNQFGGEASTGRGIGEHALGLVLGLLAGTAHLPGYNEGSLARS